MMRVLVSGGVFLGVLFALLKACVLPVVEVRFSLESDHPFMAQVYYQTPGDPDFCEQQSVSVPVGAGKTEIFVKLHVNAVTAIRLDLGSGVRNDIVLKGGDVAGVPLPPWNRWDFSGDVKRRAVIAGLDALALRVEGPDPFAYAAIGPVASSGWVCCWERIAISPFAALFAALFALSFFVPRLGRAVRFSGLTWQEFLFCLVCLSFYLLWTFQPFDSGPDEAMRFLVTKFLFENGRLPVGAETINPVWGFSYAHLPTMLCNLLGALFMRGASAFSTDGRTLYLSARAVSALCAAGTVYWALRTSKLLFATSVRWAMVTFVAAIPQFAFLSSYVNNDSVALLGMSMILFAWTSALMAKWNRANAITLAVGMSVCAMSYYNSYPWILCSLVMFPVIHWFRNGRDARGLLRHGAWVAGLTIVLGGYLFVRHVVVYGDLLGFATVRRFAAQFAAPEYLPDNHLSLYARGIGLKTMLLGMGWINSSVTSFVAGFGSMQYFLPNWAYRIYWMVGGACGLGLVWRCRRSFCRREAHDVPIALFYLSLASCAVMTVALSVFYSYTRDYQPQGRYCYPALLALAVFATKGLDCLLTELILPQRRGVCVFSLCAVLGAIAIYAYVFLCEIG